MLIPNPATPYLVPKSSRPHCKDFYQAFNSRQCGFTRHHQDIPPKPFCGYQERQYRRTSKPTPDFSPFTKKPPLHGEQPRQFHIYTRAGTSIYPPHGEPKRASKTRIKNHVGSYHSSLCCMFPNNISTPFSKDKYLTAAVLQSVNFIESRRFIIINLAVYKTPLFAERTIRDSSSTLESRFLDQSRYERYFWHPADPSALQ